jgi:prepilin-type N-terminal cleavage/methylation domain-containing protein
MTHERIVSKRGFTIIEMMVVVAVMMILAALLLPVIATARSRARRETCAHYLACMGKSMIMYSDVPAYGCFPIDRSNGRANPLPSLGILYRDYISDYRIFSCPGKPTLPQLTALGPTIGYAQSLLPLNATMTHYAYDPGNKGTGYKPHTPNDSMAIVLADFTAAGLNSDNHWPDRGQNCLRAAGSVEWLESLTNIVASGATPLEDPDITADGTLDNPEWATMKSYLSQ